MLLRNGNPLTNLANTEPLALFKLALLCVILD